MSLPQARSVRKIAVFRPNAIGDFMFALPALHALRHTYRNAEMVYLGLGWHRDLLAERPGPVDRVIVVPPEAMSQAADGAQDGARDAFLSAMRAEQFDIGLQMYGGGRQSNRLINGIGARYTIGMRTPDADPLWRSIPYASAVNRRLQLLEVAALAGAGQWPMSESLDVTPSDRLAAARLVPEAPHRPLVLLQPGASDLRRRWPAEKFAAVGDALAAMGAQVLVNATHEEAPLAFAVTSAMQRSANNLAGKASLAALCGLIERAALVVSNDTGPLHLALAIGRPAVGIYWFTNFIESAPLKQQFHRAAMSPRVSCPVCGEPNISKRCPHDASFVDDVTLDEVVGYSAELLLDR